MGDRELSQQQEQAAYRLVVALNELQEAGLSVHTHCCHESEMITGHEENGDPSHSYTLAVSSLAEPGRWVLGEDVLPF